MTKTKIQIKHRWIGSVLFEHEAEDNTILKTLLKGIKSKADLSEADLSWANLSEATLSKADL